MTDDSPAAKAEAPRSLPETVRRVERQTGGAVLRAEPMQRDGREVYRLKVLTSDGRVRVVQADPNAAAVDTVAKLPVPAQPVERPRNGRAELEKPPSRDPDGKPPQF